MNRWHQDTHDPILLHLVSQGLTDREITGRMLDDGHAVCANDVSTARRRLGMKANLPAGMTSPQDSAPPDAKPNPLSMAKVWLGKRLVEKPGGYWLDGVPVGLHDIMRAFNRMRVAMGVEQVVANETWRVLE